MLRPGTSVAASPAIAPGGSSAVNDTMVVSRTATEKEVVDIAATRKAMDEAASAERAVVDKKATDVAMVKKAVDDAVAAERAAADN
jgi:hypothetical protein